MLERVERGDDIELAEVPVTINRYDLVDVGPGLNVNAEVILARPQRPTVDRVVAPAPDIEDSPASGVKGLKSSNIFYAVSVHFRFPLDQPL
jgi:hypothetical protein